MANIIVDENAQMAFVAKQGNVEFFVIAIILFQSAADAHTVCAWCYMYIYIRREECLSIEYKLSTAAPEVSWGDGFP